MSAPVKASSSSVPSKKADKPVKEQKPKAPLQTDVETVSLLQKAGIKANCFKCKAMQLLNVVGYKAANNSSGKSVSGTCQVCGGKASIIIGKNVLEGKPAEPKAPKRKEAEASSDDAVVKKLKQ